MRAAKKVTQDRPKTLPLPAAKLTPSQDQERSRNLATVRRQRAACTVGEMRPTDWPCRKCSGERVEVLTRIAAEGGQTWSMWCYRCDHKPTW